MSKRQWQAAETSKFLENWSTAGRQPDIDIRYGLKAIRARSRLDSQNIDHVRGFLAMCVANIVGNSGVVLQSKARLSNGSRDKKLQSIVESGWSEWGKIGTCDVTGQFSWPMIQRQAIRTCARDGEAIYRVAVGFDNKFGFALQEIDPECLALDFNQSKDRNRPEIRMGVEFNEWRRPVAYYFTDEPGINSGGYNTKRELKRVQASEIIHLFLPEWTWQSRGVPWAASSLSRLHVLASYEDAEVAAASVSARKVGFYKISPDAPENYKIDDQDVGVGEFEQLPAYTDFQSFDPQHPTTAYGDFVKSCLRSVATGLGVSYNTLANDLEGVNYSSLRHGLLNERDLWTGLQDWFVESFCQKVFNAWIDQALINGLLDNVPLRRLPEAKKISWQPRRWAWVDPKRDMDANELALKLRIKSPSGIIREEGHDPIDVWEEWADDMKTMQGLGIDTQIFNTGIDNARKTNSAE